MLHSNFTEFHLVKFSPRIRWLLRIVLTVLGSLFIAACAQMGFFLPFDKEVPITFQTLAVLLVGSLYGPYMGVCTVGLYLLRVLWDYHSLPTNQEDIKFLLAPHLAFFLDFCWLHSLQ